MEKEEHMDVNFSWTCPYCNRDTTITVLNYNTNIHYFNNGNKDGALGLETSVIVCPNDKCREYTIQAFLKKAISTRHGTTLSSEQIMQWNIKPNSFAKEHPNYVPKVIVSDYKEACLIKDLSPKASATLSRRCLQGIIRDYWKVKAGKLVDEIEQISEKIDPLTWEAIDSVRKVGNIGAHMEKDIDLIVDVEPNEAELLIGLIETLINDWYIEREERKSRLRQIKEMAEQKDKDKKGK
jgi:hypothetical protein